AGQPGSRRVVRAPAGARRRGRPRPGGRGLRGRARLQPRPWDPQDDRSRPCRVSRRPRPRVVGAQARRFGRRARPRIGRRVGPRRVGPRRVGPGNATMSPPAERVGILVINFGEPDEPVPERVEPFLERIFLQNAGLEPDEEQRARARQLARDRTPGLIEEYESIGGSPLNAQAEAQAKALEDVLQSRGWNARSYSAYQFTSPSIADQVAAAGADGVETLVALPVYPLCGQSTTVAAVDATRAALRDMDDER